jgi:hypothetical protein
MFLATIVFILSVVEGQRDALVCEVARRRRKTQKKQQYKREKL